MSKKYFIDLDNTLCINENSEYENSIPIQERIDYVNNLKNEGNEITIWTARGSTSGINYRELTLRQLNEWNINYDILLMEKPNYDIYIDDKSFNVRSFWPVPTSINNNYSKKQSVYIFKKGW